MNYQKIETLTNNLRSILNIIRDYKEQIIYLQNKWSESQTIASSNMIDRQIKNCEEQIKFNEIQFKQTINQINELI